MIDMTERVEGVGIICDGENYVIEAWQREKMHSFLLSPREFEYFSANIQQVYNELHKYLGE